MLPLPDSLGTGRHSHSLLLLGKGALYHLARPTTDPGHTPPQAGASQGGVGAPQGGGQGGDGQRAFYSERAGMWEGEPNLKARCVGGGGGRGGGDRPPTVTVTVTDTDHHLAPLATRVLRGSG